MFVKGKLKSVTDITTVDSAMTNLTSILVGSNKK